MVFSRFAQNQTKTFIAKDLKYCQFMLIFAHVPCRKHDSECSAVPLYLALFYLVGPHTPNVDIINALFQFEMNRRSCLSYKQIGLTDN